VIVGLLIAAMPLTLAAQGRGQGQGRGAGPGGPGRGFAPPTGRAGAPVDLTGYWVSQVTDDWRYRMLTPPKGNVDYLPVTAEARRVANEWDPAKDEAAGEQCRSYGAVGVMRLPGRLHVTWDSDTVMKVETDAGTQTRLFRFGNQAAPSGEPTWQGASVARWVLPGGPGGFLGARAATGAPTQGELQVTTTRMRPGYIRKNGVPYSANAVLTENFARLVDDDGTQYLAVTQQLEDSVYYAQQIIRTMLFKKQADATGWNPTACSAR
jgi:hypothetical protein